MIDIILIGGGGHCHSAIDVIEQTKRYKICGIIDRKENVGKSVLGYKVLGTDCDMKEIAKKTKYALLTVGQIESADLRVNLYKMALNAGFEFKTVVSPRAYVSAHSRVSQGTLIMHDVLVNSNVTIGKNCIINTKSLIEHDSVIEDFCHISTSATVNGNVKIGECTFIGSNAVIRNSVNIEARSFVKAGSLWK